MHRPGRTPQCKIPPLYSKTPSFPRAKAKMIPWVFHQTTSEEVVTIELWIPKVFETDCPQKEEKDAKLLPVCEIPLV